jgi:hypothetical protein
MSTTLFWEPFETTKNDLPDVLKFILRKRGLPMIVAAENISYFEALRDMGIAGAQEILHAWETNGEIKIDERY